MTRTKIAVFGVVTIIGIGAIVAGISLVARNALGAPKQAVAAACSTTHSRYTVTVRDGKLDINDMHAHLCDRLTIVNADNTLRLMAFGQHDHHQPYDGIEEQALVQGQSLTVTLNQAGTFTFHDHLHDEVQGKFTVQ